MTITPRLQILPRKGDEKASSETLIYQYLWANHETNPFQITFFVLFECIILFFLTSFLCELRQTLLTVSDLNRDDTASQKIILISRSDKLLYVASKVLPLNPTCLMLNLHGLVSELLLLVHLRSTAAAAAAGCRSWSNISETSGYIFPAKTSTLKRMSHSTFLCQSDVSFISPSGCVYVTSYLPA